MDKEGSRDLTEIEMRQALNGQKGWERYKWPKSSDGKVYVPYTFQNRNSYTRKERANIFAAFKQYESKTCLRYENQIQINVRTTLLLQMLAKFCFSLNT